MSKLPSDFDKVFTSKMSFEDNEKMASLVSVMSYLTPLGWVVAMMIYDKHQSKRASFHLRQSLGLIITGAIFLLIPLVGWFLNIAVVFVWTLSLYSAVKSTAYKVPLLGTFYQEQLDFIK